MENPADFADPIEEDFTDPIEDDDAQPLPEETDGPEDQDETEEAAAPEQTEEPVKRPFVFISHRQGFELDQNIASMLAEYLRSDCDVYLDTEQPPGTRWGEGIEVSIADADFVIALITGNVNRGDSDWVISELEAAYRLWKQSGSPTLIPVHLEPIESYVSRLAATLSGFQRLDYKGDNAELLAEIRAAIFGGPRRLPPPPFGMEGFLVSDWQRDLMRAAFIESDVLADASAKLQRDNLLWIVGDDSVRNYVALSLAVKKELGPVEAGAEAETDRKIYEVTRSLSWSKVNSSTIRDAIIIFRDVAPSALFDEEKHTNELASLKFLLQRQNTLILTTSPDAYLEIQQEMRKQDFEGSESIEVTHDLYGDPDKLFIFERLLGFSKETGSISPEQYDWAHSLLGHSPAQGRTIAQAQPRVEGREIFSSIIKKWSPADIERFVTVHLRQIKRADEILTLLQRNADLDNEIHSWFISLDDSTRCFVLALALFSGLNKEQLWEKYKSIVESLHQLDSSLTLWPLGICRQRAAPYVVTEGALDFKDERIAEAVYREIAKNYREYFVELLPLMEKWSVPPGRRQRRANTISDERKRQTAEGREIRTAIARMVGKVGQYGFDDLNSLLDHWATDPILQVREAVAISLEQATGEWIGAKHVFNILDDWCRDRSNNSEALYRTWAAASALGSVAAASQRGSNHEKALDRLHQLARDLRSNTRFYVSIPLKKAARKVPLSEMENLFRLVIQDGHAATMINVAEALHEARVFNKGATLELLDQWMTSEDENQRWTALCSIILWRKQSKDERNQEIIRYLDHDPTTVASVFVETVKQKYYKTRIPALFEQLAQAVPDDARAKLIAGLSEFSFDLLDQRLLARLRSSGEPALVRLVLEVRSERWKKLLSTPTDFISALRKELNQARMEFEVYTSLTMLLRPEPDGCRRQLIDTLADCFAQNHTGLEKVLTKLKTIAPSIFEPLSVQVHFEILKRLFYNPTAFVEVITAYLSHAETVDEMRQIVEKLARPQPEGYREELLQALASGYALNPEPVKYLLNLFRTNADRSLKLIAFEFNVRLLEGELSNPTQFLLTITGAMRDAYEWEEAVQILKHLAVSEPEGKRKLLVRALAQAKITHPQEVDELLQHPSLQAQTNLSGLRLEVKVASVLNSVFIPGFLTRLFTPSR